MERVRKYIDHMGLYAAALLKWIVVGGLVGGVGGVVGALFHLGVNYATEVRLSHLRRADQDRQPRPAPAGWLIHPNGC